MKKPPAPKPRAQKPREQTDTTARTSGKRSHELTRSLQEQAFYLNVVEGKSYRKIGAELRLTLKTVCAYIRAEERRRADDLEATRESEKARSLAFYDEAAAIGIELARKAEGAFMQPLIKGLDTAIHARERRDKLLGLDAPTKIDLGVQSLLDALDDR